MKAGNARFVSAASSHVSAHTSARRAELTESQYPFAVILGCSDSRVPAEIVFDQGLGDLFVVRVAGNIAAPTQVGSVEFAVAQLGVRLVVVLGHSQCGAITATIAQMEEPSEALPGGLRVIVDLLRPTVRALRERYVEQDEDEFVEAAIRANVLASVDAIYASPTVAHAVEAQGLLVVGAEYSLEHGVVEFLTP